MVNPASCYFCRIPLEGLEGALSPLQLNPGGSAMHFARNLSVAISAFAQMLWVSAAMPLPIQGLDEPNDASCGEFFLSDHRDPSGVPRVHRIFDK